MRRADRHSWLIGLSTAALLYLGLGCAAAHSQSTAWRDFVASAPLALERLQARLSAVPTGQGTLAALHLTAGARLSVHAARAHGIAATPAEGWACRLGAPRIVFNAGFYQHNEDHVGWLKAGDTWHTAAPRRDWFGVLLAGPKQAGLPPWQLIDLKASATGHDSPELLAKLSQYEHVVQSMVLFGADGALRTKPSPRRAARTGIGVDAAGSLIVVVSEEGLTLEELALAMRAEPLGAVLAINFDGGLESQLAVASEGRGERLALRSRHASRGEIPEGLFSCLAPRGLPYVVAVDPL